MVTPVLFKLSSERGKLGFFVLGLSSTIATNGVFSPVILPCASVRGPGVSNLLAHFTFSLAGNRKHYTYYKTTPPFVDLVR